MEKLGFIAYLKIHKKKMLTLALCVLTASVVLQLLRSSRRNAKPNIIFITLDALRADHMSCYGYKRETTPHIDNLSEEGVLFTQAISAGSWTPPSVYSIATSCYPKTHGAYSFQEFNNSEVPILFQMLKNNGYYLGFISCRGKLNDNRFPELEREFDTFYPDDEHIILGYEITKNAVKWLKNNRKRTFFLWLFYLEPHAPYVPPPPFNELYINDEFYTDNDVHVPVADKSRVLYDGYGVIPRIASLKDSSSLNYYISQYDGNIRFVDELIGILMEELKRLKLYDNTLIVVSSDHGESLGEHNYYCVHGKNLYDELLRVPLILKFHSLPKNKKITKQISTIDIMPTILDVAGIDVPEEVDGISLLPLIQSGRYYPEYALSESSNIKSLRTQDWKFIYNVDNKDYELYDLSKDPKELDNVAHKQNKKFMVLKNQFWNFFSKHPANMKKMKEIFNEELRQKLESIGYLH